MTTNVQAATDAYLHLIPVAKEASAIAYTRGGHWILLWSKLISCAIAVILARFSLTGPIQNIARRADRPNRSAFLLSLSILLGYSVLIAPWFSYAEWARERSYGFTSEAFGTWLSQYLVQSLVSDFVGALLLTAFYAAARKSGRVWWIWGTAFAAIGMFLALIVQPVLLSPLLNNYKPAPSGGIRDAVETVLARAGGSGDRVLVYDGSRQSSRYTATVTGIGSSATVMLSDTMLAKGADIAEVKAVVAHELGHQRHNHSLILLTILTAIVGSGLLLTDRLFPVVAKMMGMSPQTSVSDPQGLPVLLAIFALFTLLSTPLVNTAQRLVEADADRFGLDLAQEPDGMARAVIAAADYRASRPTAAEEALFYDHPSNARRIADAMRWKTAHQAAAGQPLDQHDRKSR